MSHEQRQTVQDLKVNGGWINGQTPPSGFVLNDKGYSIPSSRLVSAVQQYTSGASTQNVPLPPMPSDYTALVPPSVSVPPVVDTPARHAGATFGRQGTRVPPNNDAHSVGSVSAVSINGRSYTGAIFDSSGNRLA